MKEHHNLPVQFNDRIHAFSVDIIPVFLTIIIVIFMDIPLISKVVIILTVLYIFSFLPNHFKKGSSLGKISSKVKVVNEDYTEVSLLTMYLRELFIFGIGFLTSFIYFVIAFYLVGKRIDKRAIHDLIFKTRVVYINPYIDNR